MAHRRIRVLVNHAQPRVRRPRLGITARGSDFEEFSQDLVVCPATGAVRLRANFERVEFHTTNTGAFQKLDLTDYSFVDLNAGTTDWREFGFNHDKQFVTYTGQNLLGVGALTVDEYAADQGWVISNYCYSSGTESDEVLIEFGWNDAVDSDMGPSVRIYADGRIEVWYDGELYARTSLSGGNGYSKPLLEYLTFTVERGRGQDMIIRSSKGAAATIRCDWVDPEDSGSVMFPAGHFWWFVPKGAVTVMTCPIVYEEAAEPGWVYGYSRVYRLAEAPETGEVLEDLTGSDRFSSVDNAHLIGHPQGGDAKFDLMDATGLAAFVPDGIEADCMIRIGLKSLDGGVKSPWVWGLHAAFPALIESTSDDEVDVTHLLSDAIDARLSDSSDGLTCSLEFRDLDALELLAPHITESEATPVRIEEYDPDEVDAPITWLDGELSTPVIRDGLNREVSRCSFEAVDRLSGAREDKCRESLPFDGMPLSRPVEDGVSAILLVLRAMGISDLNGDTIELPDLDWRLPDVPGDGKVFLPTTEWNMSAENGDQWGDVLERLFGRVPQVVWGMRPLSPAVYGFKAFEPLDTDVAISTLYRSVADAMAADAELTEEEAVRLLYDRGDSTLLPLEGNEVRVTGYDPAKRAPIAALAVWEESADPTTAPADRFKGWLGKRRSVEYGDPGLTRLEDCIRVNENIYNLVTASRSLDHYWSQLPRDADGLPIWRGEIVDLDKFLNIAEVRSVRTSAWNVRLGDESGLGYVDETEQPPSRLANISGGAMLGYGGATSWEIVELARGRVKESKRFRGFQFINSISPVQVGILT